MSIVMSMLNTWTNLALKFKYLKKANVTADSVLNFKFDNRSIHSNTKANNYSNYYVVVRANNTRLVISLIC